MDNRSDLGFGFFQIERVAAGADGAHRLEAVLGHVAVELDAIAVGVGKVDAPRDVVLDGGLDGHAEDLQLLVGLAELLVAAEPPRHVMQAGLLGARRLAGRELEERQVVVLLAEAEEDRAPLQVLVGHLQAQRPRVEIPRLAGVPDLQHDVTEPLRLNHGSLRARRARSAYLNARSLIERVSASGRRSSAAGTSRT